MRPLHRVKTPYRLFLLECGLALISFYIIRWFNSLSVLHSPLLKWTSIRYGTRTGAEWAQTSAIQSYTIPGQLIETCLKLWPPVGKPWLHTVPQNSSCWDSYVIRRHPLPVWTIGRSKKSASSSLRITHSKLQEESSSWAWVSYEIVLLLVQIQSSMRPPPTETCLTVHQALIWKQVIRQELLEDIASL